MHTLPLWKRLPFEYLSVRKVISEVPEILKDLVIKVPPVVIYQQSFVDSGGGATFKVVRTKSILEMNKDKVTDIQIRNAVKDDMKAIVEMSRELAIYHNMSNGPKISVQQMKRDGFETDPPAFWCKIAQLADKSVVGYALYFPSYSSLVGRTMIIQDLYVRSSERGRGVGKRLLMAVAKEAVSKGSSRLDFHVLEWNPARTFYESKGAVNLTKTEKWCYYRLTGESLQELSREDTKLPE